VPPARAFDGLAYDTARQNTLLLGGFDGTGIFGDTRAYSS
jgi:hypothetical protein